MFGCRSWFVYCRNCLAMVVAQHLIVKGVTRRTHPCFHFTDVGFESVWLQWGFQISFCGMPVTDPRWLHIMLQLGASFFPFVCVLGPAVGRDVVSDRCPTHPGVGIEQ
jgi:hypothetical protein